ncbi:UDP-N-acetylenolpyruvoylglucosamine reductase, partial [bacterium]
QSMADVVQEVKVINPDGSCRVIKSPDLRFRYRGSVLLTEPMVVTEAIIALQKGEREDIYRRMEEFLTRRRAIQPLDIPNAGSVFANPPGMAAGRLIDEAGGKGMQVGGARVSEKHANFIVNTGGATARDVLELIEKVQELVYQKRQIQLLTEVRVLGE